MLNNEKLRIEKEKKEDEEKKILEIALSNSESSPEKQGQGALDSPYKY